jgi:hypothetical protein
LGLQLPLFAILASISFEALDHKIVMVQLAIIGGIGGIDVMALLKIAKSSRVSIFGEIVRMLHLSKLHRAPISYNSEKLLFLHMA